LAYRNDLSHPCRTAALHGFAGKRKFQLSLQNRRESLKNKDNFGRGENSFTDYQAEMKTIYS
jgi:hypothetical protein